MITNDGPPDQLATPADAEEQGLKRLKENLRRLREDEREAQRIADLADLADAVGDAYQLGEAAEQRGDLDEAERQFRRAAADDHDDAAYRLALVLEGQAEQLAERPGAEEAARDKRAEANRWLRCAQQLGVDPPGGPGHGADMAQGPPWLLPGQPLQCTVACVDVAEFGSRRRDDDIQLHVRKSLYLVLEEAFRASPIAWRGCYREDRGDGALIVAPPGIPAAALIDPLTGHLCAGLRRYNKTASDAAQIRLRMAVHSGQIHRDDHGIAGCVVVHTFRLLEAPAFKQQFTASLAPLGVIVSDSLYNVLAQHGHLLTGLDTYRPIDVALKETRAKAWIHLAEDLLPQPRPRTPVRNVSPFALHRGRPQPRASRTAETGATVTAFDSCAVTALPHRAHSAVASPAHRRPAAYYGVSATARAIAGNEPADAPTPRGGPAFLRILLGAQLRSLREMNGITLEDAAAAIRASNSKISRLELGRVGFKDWDVARLLTLYGVTDGPARDDVRALARQASVPAWWHKYTDILPAWFERYIGMEEAAALIRTYEVQFVPGLLQTEDYARAIIMLRHADAPRNEIERRVALRMARQKLLTAHEPPVLWAIIDELALRRPVRRPGIMRAQLQHLIHLGERLPNITLQVLPLDAIVHPGSGPFTILRFPQDDLGDAVYLEQLTSALYLESGPDVDRYTAAMERLSVQAAPPRDTAQILTKILAEPSPETRTASPLLCSTYGRDSGTPQQ